MLSFEVRGPSKKEPPRPKKILFWMKIMSGDVNIYAQEEGAEDEHLIAWINPQDGKLYRHRDAKNVPGLCCTEEGRIELEF